jgi:hypothetical protein
MGRTPARGPRRLFFFFVFLPMLCVFPYLRAINNPNEYVRVFTAVAIVEKHTFRIDEPVNLWGWTNDMARVVGKDDGQGHYYMVKAPLSTYMGVPGYFIFSKVIGPLLGHHYPTVATPMEERLWWLKASTWALRIFASNIPCFLFLVWFERYLRDFTRDPALRFSAVAAVGLGTNYLAYTHMFASHSQYAAAAFLAFAITEREMRNSPDARQRRISRAYLAGFFTSACVALEYHALFLAIILSLFATVVFRRPKRLLMFILGGLTNVPAVMYFHWRAYGNPLTPGHQMLETQRFAIEHQTGLWGVVWPTWDHFAALAVDPGFGFFGMSPFMWLGVLAIPLVFISPFGPYRLQRSLRTATFVWFLCGLTLFLVNAGIIEWRAGWTVGPRYLAAGPGFFAFGAVCALERIAQGSRLRRAIARGIAGGLALAGILAIGTVGLLYDTLPETMGRPFTQFSLPLIWTGFVPHHVGEWFGWNSTIFWYIACGAMIAAPIVATLAPYGDPFRVYVLRFCFFFAALGAGIAPAFTKPEDRSPLFVLHPSVREFPSFWEPPGRDRVSQLRIEAERHGPRGPCLWHRLAELEHVLGAEFQAMRDTAKAGATPAADCRANLFGRR